MQPTDAELRVNRARFVRTVAQLTGLPEEEALEVLQRVNRVAIDTLGQAATEVHTLPNEDHRKAYTVLLTYIFNRVENFMKLENFEPAAIQKAQERMIREMGR
jgi:hypothetical protein